jgi:hypothetical protein
VAALISPGKGRRSAIVIGILKENAAKLFKLDGKAA